MQRVRREVRLHELRMAASHAPRRDERGGSLGQIVTPIDMRLIRDCLFDGAALENEQEDDLREIGVRPNRAEQELNFILRKAINLVHDDDDLSIAFLHRVTEILLERIQGSFFPLRPGSRRTPTGAQ